jgi:hypothetical protein
MSVISSDINQNRNLSTNFSKFLNIKVHDDPLSVFEMFHAYRRTKGSSELNRRSTVRTSLKENKQEKEITEWGSDRTERAKAERKCATSHSLVARRSEGGYKFDLEQNS